MKILTIGKISNQELADWFGITSNTLSKSKAKKLEELAQYAEFHIEKNHVIIDKVINAEYKKVSGSALYQEIKEQIDETWNKNNGIDTCSRVSEQIAEIIDSDAADGTIYNYTIKGRNELYGKPFMESGSLGSCTYLWCKKNDDGTYSELTSEEKRIKEDLQKKYFGDTTEKQILVKAMVEAGEITKEEAWDTLEEITNMKTGNFMGFLKELQLKLGCKIVKGTQVNRFLTGGDFERGLDFREA